MSCPYCCWALEPSGDGKTKSYTTYNNAFILCLFECVFMFGCRQWVLYRNVLTGGEWEKSWRTVRVEVQIFLFPHPHPQTDINTVFWCRKCARGTWLRSIMKVLRPTETDSLLCMRVKIPSTRPISASFAGTSEPIRAINTIRPTCQSRIRQQSTS